VDDLLQPCGACFRIGGDNHVARARPESLAGVVTLIGFRVERR
jgi:hypothetical protein